LSLVYFFALVGSFLVGLCMGYFLATYVLNGIKKHVKQMCVHGYHTSLMKFELILLCMWAHPKNVTHQISLGLRHIHGNCTGLGALAVVPARQLHNVGVELLHVLHKLMYADALGLLEHV
jgi:hypothetical protein